MLEDSDHLLFLCKSMIQLNFEVLLWEELFTVPAKLTFYAFLLCQV